MGDIGYVAAVTTHKGRWGAQQKKLYLLLACTGESIVDFLFFRCVCVCVHVRMLADISV